MKRKILDKLIDWKSSARRKPLILEGARQVGKTYLLEHEFGEKYFDNMLKIDFSNASTELLKIFEGEIEPHRLIASLETFYEIDIRPETTLLFFDEIQDAPRALTSLKYFCEDAPEYCVVAAGSLLGVFLGQDQRSNTNSQSLLGQNQRNSVSLHTSGQPKASNASAPQTSQAQNQQDGANLRSSFPVGKVKTLCLEPMDFEEFLLATGKGRVVKAIKENPGESLYDAKLLDSFREYMVVGGMPEAVQSWVDEHNFDHIKQIHEAILSDYRNDFHKHSSQNEAIKIRQVFESLPRQFAKQSDKFLYGVVRESARAREYENAVEWLVDAGLVRRVYRVERGDKIPLKSYLNLTAFKLYFVDIGLFRQLAEIPASVILDKNGIFDEFNGFFAEQFVLQQLAPERLYYWTGATSEIDFIVQRDTDIVPIEVKSGENVKSKSLGFYRQKYHPSYALRFSLLPLKEDDQLINIPLFKIFAEQEIISSITRPNIA